MAANFFQRRRILKGANYLALTPVRIHAHVIGEDGRVILIVPKFKNPVLRQWLIPRNKSDHFRIHLDGPGSATWLAIDGVSNVSEICSRLEESLGEKISPAESRVTRFLTLLYDQRYITFKELDTGPSLSRLRRYSSEQT
ncbi:MAG: PqqD family protein [Bacteroidales bacterium]|nr:PqqD family protein [Lentimicrobiaceae bacterium]MDD5695352.1 PqqD family protein [Bacteroidales bacterium]